MEILTESAVKTQKVGECLGTSVLKAKGKVFIALNGDLGSGKTTFLQGFAKGVGVKDEITSPTFLIYKKYEAKKGRMFYHFDAYRIKNKDLSLLNFKEIIESEKSIVAVEWSENIKEQIPKDAVRVYFSIAGPQSRRLIVEGDNDIMNGSFL